MTTDAEVVPVSSTVDSFFVGDADLFSRRLLATFSLSPVRSNVYLPSGRTAPRTRVPRLIATVDSGVAVARRDSDCPVEPAIASTTSRLES